MTKPRQKPQRNYIHRTWLAAAALIAVLTAVSFIPPFTVLGVTVRRANIWSDLLTFDDAVPAGAACYDGNDPTAADEMDVDFEVIAAEIAADTVRQPQTVISYEWTITQPDGAGHTAAGIAAARETQIPEPADGYTPVEDFDTTGMAGWTRFLDRLSSRQPVRIAVLGDSFIEGDIMTCDLRGMLQKAFGAADDGTGFAPTASPLTGFRRTVKTRSSGWTSYNVMQQKRTPEALADKYMTGGWICVPAAGASARWEPTSYAREQEGFASHADIYFLSPADSRLEAELNDTLTRRFEVEGSPLLRRISVEAPAISSLTLRVTQPGTGFIAYGASFYGHGVTLDNYSVRSNSGQALLRMNHSLNAQLDNFTPYDLVVLQYGLNIMQQGRYNYDNYTSQVEKFIGLVRSCFPSAAVLVMGVSDRSVKSESGGFSPMDALPHMTEAQRQAARNTGAAFWNTCDAMQREGGMARFVADGCAGKDYTHINYAGGRRIARALFDAISAAAGQYSRRRAAEEQAAAIEAVLTNEFATMIDSLLTTPPVMPARQ